VWIADSPQAEIDAFDQIASEAGVKLDRSMLRTVELKNWPAEKNMGYDGFNISGQCAW